MALNAGQGYQFTSAGWIDLVTSNLTNFKAQNISYFLLKVVLTKGCTIGFGEIESGHRSIIQNGLNFQVPGGSQKMLKQWHL